MDDRAQRGVEFETGRHCEHCVDQAVEAVASFDDLLNALLHLTEQLTQSQPR